MSEQLARGARRRRTPSLLVALAAILAAALLAPSAGAAALPASLPSSPQYPMSWIGSSSVAVAWDPPAAPGGTVTYQARAWATIPPTAQANLVGSCSSSGRGCVIGGLTSGTFYYVDVVAINASGTGNPSSYQQVLPGSTASAPRSVTVQGGNGTVTARWQSPATFGTGTFAWYRADAFGGTTIAAGTPAGYCTATSSGERTCTIYGLVNGRTYYVSASTWTSQNSGPASARIPVVVGLRPSVPRSVAAAARDRAARVSWLAPASNGGMAITAYRVRVFAHGAATALKTYALDAAARTLIARSLVNGRRYDVTVAALNRAGEGRQSARVTVTPRAG